MNDNDLSPDQTQTLDSVWKAEFLLSIKKNDRESFYPSDIRKRCIMSPSNENLIGALFRHLVRKKQIMKTGL